MQEGKLTKKK